MIRLLAGAAIGLTTLIFLPSCFGLETTFAASPDDTMGKTIPQGQDPPGADEEGQTTQPSADHQGVITPPPVGDEDIYTQAPNPEAGHKKEVIPPPGTPGGDPNIEPR
jgi:hypothetical protein